VRFNSTVADLAGKLTPVLEALLEPGEQLRGACVATQQSTFRGRMVGIAVTDDRLIVQGLSRRFEPDGEPLSLPPDAIADASVDGAGGGWLTVGMAVLDRTAITLKLRTADGQKLKLMMMRGDAGTLGKLGGGEGQRQGVEALGDWFTRHPR
jgi:hypothetical protein